MAARKKKPSVRNRGKQERSKETFELLVRAAIRVLEKDPAGFNTNAVADVSGVSVGTLYQYFANKQAMMAEVIRRELEHDRAIFERELSPDGAPSLEAAVDRVVRVALQINERHPNLQRAMFEHLVPSGQMAHVREMHFANARRVAAFLEASHGWPGGDPYFFSLLSLSIAASVFQMVTQYGGVNESQARHHLRRLMLGYLEHR